MKNMEGALFTEINMSDRYFIIKLHFKLCSLPEKTKDIPQTLKQSSCVHYKAKITPYIHVTSVRPSRLNHDQHSFKNRHGGLSSQFIADDFKFSAAINSGKNPLQ
jgi:hypothetical protein